MEMMISDSIIIIMSKSFILCLIFVKLTSDESKYADNISNINYAYIGVQKMKMLVIEVCSYLGCVTR